MSMITYYPEMGETKPENTDGNVTLSHSGKHYFIDTPWTLNGRGIEHIEVLLARNLTPQGQYKAGWNVYRVTQRAMDALSERYTFARQALLD